IGFDLEWKPNFRPGQPENPIAVVQIAYGTASYVVHVKWMQYLPDGLAEILENPRIVKVGVGIQNDAKKLYKDLGICLNSCVDLSLFVKCRLFRGPYTSSIGLARLAEVYEGLVLTKGKITRSNWDLELTPAQLTYAALDAYAGSLVYSHLIRLFHLLD
ncbi:ribonuclease H-like domain-containing protein, partial [Lentinula raphanica]